ncbi:Threonine--tRNA ligase [Scenedesmus sp. PABB004]|nr:Threonine--tRNA ligase [Scenedesmus sp. PABB004]
MQYLYGNHVLKSGLGRITESTPAYAGVVVYSMADIPLGFGLTAKSTNEARGMEPSGIVVLHQADVGEYLRAEDELSSSRMTSRAAARLLGRAAAAALSRRPGPGACEALAPAAPAAWLAARRGAASSAAPRLAGKNIFQLRAAAGAVEAAEAAAPPAAQAGAAEIVPLPTSDESDRLLRIRHSCAHVMAMAVQRLHKDAQVTIGPWIERGFYYDFDLPTPLSDKELKAIRKEMQKIIKMKLPFVREEVSAEEAAARIRAINEPYKLEILESITARDPAAAITIYHIGETDHPAHWWDLCAGPHVETTGDIPADAFELESVAGAYWRGDETKPMLQRIYGTAWESAAQLSAYTTLKAEAARRDHRKLGAELDLFSIQESAGGGLVFWHPKGAIVRHVLEGFWKDLHLSRGYDLVYSPHIAKRDLWVTSGHLEFYSESMFDSMTVEEEAYQLKPMNCPFHVAMFNDGHYSYRDLPLRWAELGTVYRYERSGTMHGLFRVRGFTQDDAHIFCLPDQIEGEIRGVLDLVEEVLSAFGFTQYEVNLSTRPEKHVGGDEIWDTAEAALVKALGAKGWPYVVDEGGGAFYGPKIDIKIQDAIGRKWQCSTIQLDFNLPQRFDMTYTDAGAAKQRPIMIHRAILGSIERFFGILVENYAGAFPLWLAPVHARLMPVNDAVVPYANEVASRMRGAGLRVQVMERASIAKMVRTAERAKTPVMAVIGAKEAEAGSLSVRLYGGADLGALPVGDVIDRMTAAVRSRTAF